MALAPGYQILDSDALDQKAVGVEENQFSALAKGDFTLFLTRAKMPGEFIGGNQIGAQVNLTELPQPKGLDGNMGAFLGVAAGADALHQAISEKGENENVLIHCQHGRERTPAVVAYYLIKYEGMTGQDAVSLVHQALHERLGEPQDSFRNQQNNAWLRQLDTQKIKDFESQVVDYKGEQKSLLEHFSELYTNEDGIRLLSGDFQRIATSNKQLKTFMEFESKRLTRSGAQASASAQLRDEPAPVATQIADDEKKSKAEPASVSGQSDELADERKAEPPSPPLTRARRGKQTLSGMRKGSHGADRFIDPAALRNKHRDAHAQASAKAEKQKQSSTKPPEPTRPKSPTG